MRRRTFIFLFLFITILYFLSFTDNEAQAGPKIFLPESEWDFGYIPQGSVVSHIFWIRNIGDDTLQIIQVRPGCLCTYAPLKKDLLAPNDSTYLEVVFKSKNYQGKKDMAIAIYSNDTSTISDIYFSVNIENEMPLIQINPAEVRFDSLKAGKNLFKKVSILNKSDTVLGVALADKPKGIVDFQIPFKELKPKEEAEIIFQINPKATPESFQTSLTLDFFEVSSGKGVGKLRCTLPISATIVSE